MVTIAVIAVLVSLVVGAVAGFRKRARTVDDIVRLRQNITAVQMYLGSYQDIFPISDSDAFTSANEWYVAVERAGIFNTIRESDPVGCEEIEWPRFMMSVAMCYPVEAMTPGQTRPIDSAFARPIRLAQIMYPSQKGIMIRMIGSYSDADTAFCCGSVSPKAPMAGVDGAVTERTRMECEGGADLRVVDRIGIPVYSTWLGANGIDWR